MGTASLIIDQEIRGSGQNLFGPDGPLLRVADQVLDLFRGQSQPAARPEEGIAEAAVVLASRKVQMGAIEAGV
jgi:hypothetical protein